MATEPEMSLDSANLASAVVPEGRNDVGDVVIDVADYSWEARNVILSVETDFEDHHDH